MDVCQAILSRAVFESKQRAWDYLRWISQDNCYGYIKREGKTFVVYWFRDGLPYFLLKPSTKS